MKINKKKIVVLSIISFSILILAYYLNDMRKFTKGVQEDKMKRDSFFEKKGITIDSMGTVNYEDYKEIINSTDTLIEPEQ